jgi:hypothetical protein
MKQVAALALLFPAIGFAEVMDKELSFSAVVVLAILGTVFAFASARWLPWALLVVVPVVAVLFYAHLSEVADPAIRGAMLNEAGTPYVVFSLVSPLVAAAGVGIGFYLRGRRAHTAR